ncbi:MAG TPA: HAD-IIA family hydrolase [Candidatus Paceibacterota bacterium]|nr:HAD-IIA family hydrolase [Candidatus Paceibacterota bacterium]
MTAKPDSDPDLVLRLRALQHVALDMDGTIYSGGTLFPFTIPFLQLLEEMGIGYTFLTNNSSRSTSDYLAHLEKIGIKASQDQLYTSTQATIEHLEQELPDLKRLFVLGTASMRQEMVEAGFMLTEDTAEDEPDAVVVGFDTGLVYRRLCRAAYWIKQGKYFIATHPDRICPTDQPTVLVDCGAICAALKEATGRGPDMTLGKPDPCMIRGILHRHALRPGQLAMVGDRLYTDVAMARRAGAFGVLVLTGETTAEQAAKHSPAPDLIVSGLDELGERLREARRRMALEV